MKSLEHLSDSALTARLYEIRKEERALLVEFLQCLTELERRDTLLALGYSSTFVFCTEYLGMPKSTTYRRTKTAELMRRFPAVEEYLADGRLNTRTLVLLKDVLDEQRLTEILDRRRADGGSGQGAGGVTASAAAPAGPVPQAAVPRVGTREFPPGTTCGKS